MKYQVNMLKDGNHFDLKDFPTLSAVYGHFVKMGHVGMFKNKTGQISSISSFVDTNQHLIAFTDAGEISFFVNKVK
jgi:hypothetical protein